MANLIIDIGNIVLKAAWCDQMTLGRIFRYQGEKMMDFILSLTAKNKAEIMVLSSVRTLTRHDIARLKEECGRLVVIDADILQAHNLPAYLSPDRAASVIASRYLFKGRGCTVFDFGTTLTVDFLDREGSFLGGNISVGCRSRFKAVNRYTRALPLVDTPVEIEETGSSVTSSIATGVIKGIMFEIEGYIASNPENITVFTGGDAIYFAKRMKNSIFVVCNLVLMGLALIAMEYDEDKI
ncbi:MAG: type III pantothenate kinase [Candidatus Cryptobacteroides sp.]